MKGLMIFSTHMEDVEALGTRALLKRAGIEVETATFESSKAIITSYNQTVVADHLALDIDLNSYDFLVIPGGPYVQEIIDQEAEIQNLAKSFNEKGKLISAICAGPRFLGRSGLLDGKNYTAYAKYDHDIKGIYQPTKKAIKDQNIITGKGAGAVYEFASEIITYLLDKEIAEKVLKSIHF